MSKGSADERWEGEAPAAASSAAALPWLVENLTSQVS